MKSKNIFGVMFREKPATMLTELLATSREIYASSLAKKVDCTYSHVVKILKEMNKAGLVEFKKEGRLKILSLTKKGEEVAKNINCIKKLL